MDAHRRLVGPLFSDAELGRVARALASEAPPSATYTVVELSAEDLQALTEFVQTVRPPERPVERPVARLLLFDLKEP